MHYTILSLNCHRISSGEFLGLGLSTLVHQGHHLLESNQSLVSQSPVKPYSNPNPESNPSCSSPSPVKSSSNPNPDSNPFRSSPKPNLAPLQSLMPCLLRCRRCWWCPRCRRCQVSTSSSCQFLATSRIHPRKHLPWGQLRADIRKVNQS